MGAIAALPLLPIQNGSARTLIERPADRYALDLTRKREAFAGAMEQLRRMNLADPQPPALVKWFLRGHLRCRSGSRSGGNGKDRGHRAGLNVQV